VGLVKQPKDFLAGVLFVAIGLFFLLDAVGVPGVGQNAAYGSGYTFGNVRRMGPGWFPTVVASILIGIGLIVAVKSFIGRVEGGPVFAWQPLVIISLSIVAFTLLLRPAGVIPATIALVMISAYGYRPVKVGPMLVAGIGLGLFCGIVFVMALGLPLTKFGPAIDQVIDPYLNAVRDNYVSPAFRAVRDAVSSAWRAVPWN
jgi:hypothetical protein